MNHELAHQHLAATHPRLAALIARSRRYDIAPSLSIRPFDALAESIAYQQLSGKVAATIFGRVRALYPRRKMAALSLRRCVVFLARPGCAGKVTELKGLQLEGSPPCNFCNSFNHLTCASFHVSLKRAQYGNDPRQSGRNESGHIFRRGSP